MNQQVANLIEFFGLNGPARKFTLANGTSDTYEVQGVLSTGNTITGLRLRDAVGRTFTVPWHAVTSIQQPSTS